MTLCARLLACAALGSCASVKKMVGIESEPIQPELVKAGETEVKKDLESAVTPVEPVPAALKPDLPGQPPEAAVKEKEAAPTPLAATDEKKEAAPDTRADAARDFARAKSLVDEGKESEALQSLADFLRRYPQHDLADDAQFYVGEIYFRRRNFELAYQEFRKVASYNGGKADRIPDAGVRAGECLEKMHDSERAVIEWEAVKRRFPASPAAARAETLVQGALAAAGTAP